MSVVDMARQTIDQGKQSGVGIEERGKIVKHPRARDTATGPCPAKALPCSRNGTVQGECRNLVENSTGVCVFEDTGVEVNHAAKVLYILLTAV